MSNLHPEWTSEIGSSGGWILLASVKKARGRMIDDDIKVAVMLKRSPKELRDHLGVGESTTSKRGIQVHCDA